MGRHSINETTAETQRITIPYRQSGQHRAPHSTMATVALIWAFITLPWGWIIFGVPNAIAAYLGWKALGEFADSDDVRSGQGQAAVGFLTGLIGTALGVIALIAVIFF